MLDLHEHPEWIAGGSAAISHERPHKPDVAIVQNSDERIAHEIRTVMAARGLIQHANHMLIYVDKKLVEISCPQLRTEIRVELERWLKEYMR